LIQTFAQLFFWLTMDVIYTQTGITASWGDWPDVRQYRHSSISLTAATIFPVQHCSFLRNDCWLHFWGRLVLVFTSNFHGLIENKASFELFPSN